jgi:hypothetical protein
MAETAPSVSAKWQDVANLVLGVWLFVSPWILKFTGIGLAPVNAWIFGIIIAVIALLALFAYQQWEEWLNAAIGVWVFFSPWVLSLSHYPNVRWNNLIVGALLAILALWSVSLEHGSGEVMSRS